MWAWKVASYNELQHCLKAIPSYVPPRGMGRTAQHIENWVLRHLLWTLANTSSLLAYPLSVRKGERPDLDVETADSRVGIEVTEAIPESYAQAIAIQNRDYPAAILDPSLFQYGSRTMRASDIRSLLQREGHHLIGPGWMGDSVEQEWAARMAARVLSKTELLNERSFRRQERNWLAIYDNTPRPCLELGIAIGYLLERLAGVRRGAVEFDRVFIELSNELVMVADNHGHTFPIHRPGDVVF